MKAKLVALAVISAFALSACGGGSDSSPKVKNNTNGGSTVSGDTGGGSTGGSSTGGGSTGGGSTGGGSTGGGSTGGGSTGGGSTGGGSTGGGSTGGDSTGGSTATDTPFTMKQQQATYKITLKNGEPIAIAQTPTYGTSSGDGSNFKKITVDGQTFTMKDTSGNSQKDEEYGVVEQEGSKGEVNVAPNLNNGRGTAYAKYGWTIGYSTGKLTLFYQGNPTPTNEMPTTGSATYKGNAIAFDMKEYNANITKDGDYGVSKGVSEFTADFANKKLTGTLSGWHSSSAKQPKAVTIDVKIQANTFQGTANGTGTAEGKFYGTKAQNLAGAFNDKSQNLQGVFGANKQ